MPSALFSARVADCDIKEMANVILKYENQARSDSQQTSETKDFGAKILKHFIGQGSWIFSELLHGNEPAFLTKKAQQWSTEESYLWVKKVVVPIRVLNDGVERSLRPVTDYHIDRITRGDMTERANELVKAILAR